MNSRSLVLSLSLISSASAAGCPAIEAVAKTKVSAVPAKNADDVLAKGDVCEDSDANTLYVKGDSDGKWTSTDELSCTTDKYTNGGTEVKVADLLCATNKVCAITKDAAAALEDKAVIEGDWNLPKDQKGKVKCGDKDQEYKCDPATFDGGKKICPHAKEPEEEAANGSMSWSASFLPLLFL